MDDKEPPYILLISSSGYETFHEFKTRGELAQTITTFYEDILHKILMSDKQNEDMEYTTDQLFEFIDTNFDEICCLELNEGAYVPYPADWIKDAIFLELRQRCQDLKQDEEMMEL